MWAEAGEHVNYNGRPGVVLADGSVLLTETDTWSRTVVVWPECSECDAALAELEFPNEMLGMDDSDGDIYWLCQRCIDYEAEYQDADEATRDWMSGEGYLEWQSKWERDERETRGLPRHPSLLDEVLS